jgi:probable phosphoglycerate mutase
MTRRIIVWRHGQTAWNAARRVQGQTDVPLDPLGRQQAFEAGARLASLRPTRIVSSDLSRAADTATALAEVCGVPVETDPRLREMQFGAREGLTWDEAWERMPEAMRAWLDGDESKVEGSETHAQAGERFAAAVREHADALGEDDLLVVVAHGAVSRVGTCAFVGLPEDSWGAFGALGNCAWIALEEVRLGSRLRWRIVEWNAGTLPEPVLSDDD